MKYESRRYNKNETGKEFYLRRKKEMNEALESDAYKKWSKKIWAEYKEINKKKIMKNYWITILLLFVLGCASALADEVLTRSERIVALTILGEARGEGKCGMYAVGCVIQKRASERNLTPAQVCHQPYQFSIWNAGKGKIKKESELYYLWKSKSMMYARQLARAICKNKKLDQEYTGGANHYCTLNTNNYWTKKGTVTKIIGNHKFFILQ